jgi:hypothetical protein
MDVTLCPEFRVAGGSADQTLTDSQQAHQKAALS